MIVRRRLRSILIPLALYAASVPVTGYFLWHASNGDRGLKARVAYTQEMKHLLLEAAKLKTQKESLAKRIALMRSTAIDRDLLDEQARIMLGRVHSDDVVIFLKN